jgi:hypothetical protein
MVSGCPIDAIKDRGDLQDLAPGFEEITIEHDQGLASTQHGERSPTGTQGPRLPMVDPTRASFPRPLHHRTSGIEMQISLLPR